MKRANFWLIFLMSAGLLFGGVACTAAESDEDSSAQNVNQDGAVTATPGALLDDAPDAAMQQAVGVEPSNEATINEVQVLLQESFPVQVNVVIRGSLPDSCAMLERINQARNGNQFDVAVATVHQTGMMCTEQRQTFEEVVSLDVRGLPAGTYTVEVSGVNQMSDSFALAVDNVAPQAPPTPELVGNSVEGIVWADRCQLLADGAPGEGCIGAEDGGYRADGVFDPDEPRIEGIAVQLRLGECPGSPEPVGQATTDATGAYLFTSLQPAIYCVDLDADSVDNRLVLNSGVWSYPADSSGRQTVDLNATDYQTADFGWDYQPGGVAPAAEATTSTTEATPAPTETAATACENGAAYVADVTIPDDTTLAPGESFVKTWRVENTGTCTWDADYRLVFSEGAQLGGNEATTLPQVVAPGEQVDVSVSLTAPESPGSYRGDWLLQDGAGNRFGSRGDFVFYVQIIVAE